jgi:hypothetical protein
MRTSRGAHAPAGVVDAASHAYVALQEERHARPVTERAAQESETAMTDTTYGAATPAPAAAERKGLFARILDALYESRMRQVEREIRQNLHLIPQDILERTEFKVPRENKDRLPFVR